MYGIKVQITRFVDNHQPGFVECCLIDAREQQWMFIEKVPVVSREYMDEYATYPQPGFIACEIIRCNVENDGRVIITVNTERPWRIESTTGERHFDVLLDQLIEVDHVP